MNLKALAVKIITNANLLVIYKLAGGLSEFWALVFGTAGIVLAFRGKLDGNFAAMIVAVQGLLVAHDGIDDFLQHKKEERGGGPPNGQSTQTVGARANQA
jgi:hypothetical protein